ICLFVYSTCTSLLRIVSIRASPCGTFATFAIASPPYRSIRLLPRAGPCLATRRLPFAPPFVPLPMTYVRLSVRLDGSICLSPELAPRTRRCPPACLGRPSSAHARHAKAGSLPASHSSSASRLRQSIAPLDLSIASPASAPATYKRPRRQSQQR